MQVVETSSEGLMREFTIRIPAGDIETKLTNRLQELSGKIQKPGFRPGKVPMPLLRKQYGPSLMGEILEQAVADGTRQALTEKGYRPAVQPKIEIKSFEEGKTIQAIIGGQSVGSAGTDLVILSNELFGTKFKIITGYKSSTDVKLAMEKGEVHGTFGNSYTSLTTEQPDWLRDKFVRIIIQHGLAKHRELPDVPQFIEQAKTPADRQLLELVLARQETGKPYFTTPDVPKERLQALRDAFDATLKDPKFHAALAKIRLPTDSPMGGAEVAELAGRLAGTSPDVVQRMEGILNKFREGR